MKVFQFPRRMMRKSRFTEEQIIDIVARLRPGRRSSRSAGQLF
jgi:hypothetical protein